jgi:hypothetical protein
MRSTSVAKSGGRGDPASEEKDLAERARSASCFCPDSRLREESGLDIWHYTDDFCESRRPPIREGLRIAGWKAVAAIFCGALFPSLRISADDGSAGGLAGHRFPRRPDRRANQRIPDYYFSHDTFA